MFLIQRNTKYFCLGEKTFNEEKFEAAKKKIYWNVFAWVPSKQYATSFEKKETAQSVVNLLNNKLLKVVKN